MARHRKSNRRRKGRSGFLYKLLSVLAICICLVTAMTLFFRVDSIVVTGGVRYTEQQLRDATGVKEGENLLLLNKGGVAASMVEALPYLREISSINKRLPDTLVIAVEECGKPLAVIQDGSAWLICSTSSGRGKIVEQIPEADASEYGVIDGCRLLAPSVGTSPALASEYAVQQSSLLSLLGALEETGMLEQVEAVHLGEPSEISVEYAGRFTIELSCGADYPRKLNKLMEILAGDVIQENMTGTFDMRGDSGRDIFRQNTG